MDGLTERQRLEVDALSPEQRARYEELRARDQTHNWALMAATDSWPTLRMADERMARSQDGKRMGVSARGRYEPALARYPGDPRAFVTSKREARRVCDQLSHEEGAPVRISDGPEHAGTGRQDLLRRARAGDNRARDVLDRELEVA